MDDYKNNDTEYEHGNISGFDSVNGTPPTDADSAEKGYTVTPDGGYYTRRSEDIIQDDISAPEKDEPKTAPQAEHTGTDFRPNGNYGTNQNAYSAPVKPQKPKKPRQKYSAAIVIVAVVLAAVIGATSGVLSVLTLKTADKSTSSGSSTSSPTSNVNITVDEKSESIAQAVAAKATKSVVGIRTTTSVTNFFGGSSESTGEGSGVIYSADGYIITNYHVIETAVESSESAKIEVFLGNSNTKSYKASVVGYNISNDLAVLKIDASGLTPAEIGDSSKLSVGQYVVTIGSAGGLEFMGSVTYGIISGLDRAASTTSSVSLIQTDAAINPGNSGGALLDANGKLIGINSSKIVSTEYEGMGFSIPVNTVKKVCDNIIAKKDDPEPYIGITVSVKYTADTLLSYGYPAGAVVVSIDEDSPADKAGIQRGDIITEFNGTEITEYTMLEDALKDCTPGKSVSVKIYRSGRYYSTSITIGSNS